LPIALLFGDHWLSRAAFSPRASHECRCGPAGSGRTAPVANTLLFIRMGLSGSVHRNPSKPPGSSWNPAGRGPLSL